MLGISINIGQLLGNIQNNDTSINQAIERLSTGLNINSIADDPSGVAISNKERARYSSIEAADNNIQEAIVLLQSKDQALQKTLEIVTKMREIAERVSSDSTLPQSTIDDAQNRIWDYLKEIRKIQTELEMSNSKLLDKQVITFQSNRSGTWDLYNINLDTNTLSTLVQAAGTDATPAWSPDGSKVAFLASRDGNNEIYILDMDTLTQKNITNNIFSDGVNGVTWSPDGTQIAFVTTRTGNNEIYVMNSDGSNLRNISNDAASDTAMSWSPDGTKIAFVSNRTGNNEIYVVNADGTGLTNVSNDASSDTDPVWSPDGSKIAFYSGRSGGGDLYSINSDGTNLTQITSNAAMENYALWSLQGDEIIFSRVIAGRWQLFKANADGSGEVQLTNTAAGHNYMAQWSSDYESLIFITSRTGNWEVYSMNADGSSQKNLTSNAAYDTTADEPYAWYSILNKLSVQIGPDNGDTTSIILRPAMPINLGIEGLNVSDTSFASITLDRIDGAIEKINSYRAEIATMTAGLHRFSEANSSELSGLDKTISTIENTDDALEQANITKATITQYFSISSVVHSNLTTQKASEYLIDYISDD